MRERARFFTPCRKIHVGGSSTEAVLVLSTLEKEWCSFSDLYIKQKVLDLALGLPNEKLNMNVATTVFSQVNF